MQACHYYGPCNLATTLVVIEQKHLFDISTRERVSSCQWRSNRDGIREIYLPMTFLLLCIIFKNIQVITYLLIIQKKENNNNVDNFRLE